MQEIKLMAYWDWHSNYHPEALFSPRRQATSPLPSPIAVIQNVPAI